MKRLIVLIFAVTSLLPGFAYKYSYRFKSTPVGVALLKLIKEDPELKISFIYNELNDYTTSATVNADNPLQAIKQLVGLNPVTVTEYKNKIFVEALQKGKYRYTGRVINEFDEGIPFATVYLLNPKDSVTITYGITKENGSFSIPCDEKDVAIKITSIGYHTLKMPGKSFSLGNLKMKTLAINLDAVTVDGGDATLMTDKTVYVPRQRQKNSSISGIDLLDRMGIPQIIMKNGKPESTAGKPISLYIDYMPASDEDLTNMNLQDVKRVEYYEFPADPRFQGNQYVVNFIMIKYEYGGYVKLNGNESFVLNSGYLSGNVRFQYKKMTYDIYGYGKYNDNHHMGKEVNEIFRLPQEDETLKVFDRYSKTESSKYKNNSYSTNLRATYMSEKVAIRNTVKASLSDIPQNNSRGIVTYTPQDFPNSDYSSTNDENTKYLGYDGIFNFSLPNNDALSFYPSYSYSHTKTNSSYLEKDFDPVRNSAVDNTNSLSADLRYRHEFGKAGNLSAYGTWSYNYYRTNYSGSAIALDKSKNIRGSAGINYDLYAGNFYGEAGLGWNWDKITMNNTKSTQSTPKLSLFLQYKFSSKHRLSASVTYYTWAPNASFKSENIIKANHLMSYTGNPSLVPTKALSTSFNYNWYPSPKFNMAIYGDSFSLNDRYVYNYKASPDGILRTIEQPLGGYAIGQFGLSARLLLLDKNLQLSGYVRQQFAHNGAPFNFTRWPRSFSFSANYYLGDFYFSGSYRSRMDYSDGFMVGHWMEYKDSYTLMAGWANSKWNIRLSANNFGRWNHIGYNSWFKTEFYDYYSTDFDPTQCAYFSVTATFTIRYGKKVRSDNEPSNNGGATSGILKQ